MLRFEVQANRVDGSGSTLTSKETTLTLDTSIAGRPDALNPVELLLAAQAACFIKGIERLAPTLNFDYSSVKVMLEADRPEDQARLSEVRYGLIIGTNESDHRLELLHKNLQKQGTIYNTLSAGTNLIGTVTRQASEQS
jgi:uncharacterized OsmC-like protein